MTDDIEQRLDAMSKVSRAKTREIITEAGRPDILAEYDRAMRDLDLGITTARGCWHTLSSTQRYVLRTMGNGRYLTRALSRPTQYDAVGKAPAILGICRLATARKLCAHELIHVNGGATDPEALFVITERGAFVLKWGST